MVNRYFAICIFKIISNNASNYQFKIKQTSLYIVFSGENMKTYIQTIEMNNIHGGMS